MTLANMLMPAQHIPAGGRPGGTEPCMNVEDGVALVAQDLASDACAGPRCTEKSGYRQPSGSTAGAGPYRTLRLDTQRRT